MGTFDASDASINHIMAVLHAHPQFSFPNNFAPIKVNKNISSNLKANNTLEITTYHSSVVPSPFHTKQYSPNFDQVTNYTAYSAASAPPATATTQMLLSQHHVPLPIIQTSLSWSSYLFVSSLTYLINLVHYTCL